MSPSIAFVGAGPTALYTLAALLSKVLTAVSITVFEAQTTAGFGTPYSPEWNDDAMLANIASIEIPPVTETLLAWMQRQSAPDLGAVGVDASTLDDRAFYPRVALGRYFRDQFDGLVAVAQDRGIEIETHTGCKVIDARCVATGIELTLSPRDRAPGSMTFDHVVLATGHQWPSRQQIRPGYFLSPWPVAGLAATPAVNVGIRGSSLTAIDAAVALGSLHGAFVRTPAGLTYTAAPHTEGFTTTMMSRKGLLPEADFYFPLPHAPLKICTPEAIDRLISEDREDLLDAAFDLFRQEIMEVDPAYGLSHDLGHATLEQFAASYFAPRLASDPFEWAAANLEEARRNHETRTTVLWRDAILRMHEVLAPIVPHLGEAGFKRFIDLLKPVFVDTYGAVPHESIERMLALHAAGKLEVLALGPDYELDSRCPEGGVQLHNGGSGRHFPVFIDSVGQRSLSAIQFPFLSLLEQGVVRDQVDGKTAGALRGVAIDDTFQLVSDDIPAGRLFCLSLPFIMGRHPFAQGLCSSHDMGEVVGTALAAAVGHAHHSPPVATARAA